MKTHIEEFLANPHNLRFFQQEKAIYKVTALLQAVMEQQNVSRAELAQRLGKTRGWVTQLLDGDANKTIRTIADAFAVLGHEFVPNSRPLVSSPQASLTHEVEDEVATTGGLGAARVNILPFILNKETTTTSENATARVI